MGTDINYDFQRLDNSKWVNVDRDEKPELWRHSILFHILSGVSSNHLDEDEKKIVPISPPRGVPDDMVTTKKKTKLDIHNKQPEHPYSHYGDWGDSWLLGTEILRYFDNFEPNTLGRELVDDRLKYFHEHIKRLVATHGEIRIVFGFSN